VRAAAVQEYVPVSLKGKVAVVTGAGGTGCGRAIAWRLGRDGASIVVADINERGGRAAVEDLQRAGVCAAYCRADVSDERQVGALIEFAEVTFGGLDVLVNNASGPPFEPDRPLKNWAQCVQIDLLGAIYSTRFAIDAMRRRGGGAIVNVSSTSALCHGREHGGSPGYDVAKAGVIRLTTALDWLAAKERIRVNCLAPGWIATPAPGPKEYWESLSPQQRKERGAPSRLLEPEQIADAVWRLATDESLFGRVMVWWSEDEPFLVAKLDRGYQSGEKVVLLPAGVATGDLSNVRGTH
jgi:NAD(P)-dependent dehydrogenase (short-subunit alcohol dehydrogenase family)